MRDDMHDHHRILRQGSPVGEARVAAVLVHGRGGSAEDILSLASEFRAEGVAYIAPQATGHSWYPYSFLAPLTQNEPGLSSGLRLLASIVDDLNAQGLSSDRIALLGFSQGACLALEFAARNARKYTFVAAFSGALIGPDGTPRNYAGSFGGTPVFLGCSDIDPHIPLQRVHESAEVFHRMGGAVDERIYPRMGHTINRDELNAVDALLGA
jgi:predicted esterase